MQQSKRFILGKLLVKKIGAKNGRTIVLGYQFDVLLAYSYLWPISLGENDKTAWKL